MKSALLLYTFKRRYTRYSTIFCKVPFALQMASEVFTNYYALPRESLVICWADECILAASSRMWVLADSGSFCNVLPYPLLFLHSTTSFLSVLSYSHCNYLSLWLCPVISYIIQYCAFCSSNTHTYSNSFHYNCDTVVIVTITISYGHKYLNMPE